MISSNIKWIYENSYNCCLKIFISDSPVSKGPRCIKNLRRAPWCRPLICAIQKKTGINIHTKNITEYKKLNILYKYKEL